MRGSTVAASRREPNLSTWTTTRSASSTPESRAVVPVTQLNGARKVETTWRSTDGVGPTNATETLDFAGWSKNASTAMVSAYPGRSVEAEAGESDANEKSAPAKLATRCAFIPRAEVVISPEPARPSTSPDLRPRRG